MDIVNNASFRRMLAVGLAPIFAVLNKKFGWQLSESEVDVVFAIIALYIGQSAWKETAMAKINQAGADVKPKTGDELINSVNKKIEEAKKDA